MWLSALLLAAIGMLVVPCASASAVTLDFEGPTPDPLGGTAPGALYASLGVSFEDAVIVEGFPLNVVSGRNALTQRFAFGSDPTGPPGATISRPIGVNFARPIVEASVVAIRPGLNGALLSAFDSIGNLLDQDQFQGIGLGSTFETLAVSGVEITRLELFICCGAFPQDGLSWDDLTLRFAAVAVSEPTEVVLLAIWVLGAFGSSRR